MARSALTPELKAVRIIKEMQNQRDYSRHHFALLLMNDGDVNDAIAMASAIIEMAAIKADTGDFDKDTRDWVLSARSMRNALLDFIDRDARVR